MTILDRIRRTDRLTTARTLTRENSQPPFGYRAEAGELVADDAERATVARIEELRAGGLSLRAIADVLEEEGRRPRRGERWHPKVIASALSRG